MKKLILYFTVFLFLVSCTQEKPIRIGVSQCSQDDWRTKLNDELENEVLFHNNVEIEIRSADDNSKKQIDDLEYFVSNGFDAILVSPNEAVAVTPKIKEIYEAGIPIIVFDRNTSERCYSAFISADNYDIGKKAAIYVNELPGAQHRIVEIYGLPGSTPAIDRNKGFYDNIDEASAVVASVVANWNYDDAYRAVDSLLTAGMDFDVVYAHNDRMAIGASDALQKHRKRDKVQIIGVDAAPHIGIQAAKDGVIDVTFFYPTAGSLLFETALNALQNPKFAIDTILPSPSAVNAINAESYLMMNQELENENRRVGQLKKEMIEYWSKHTAQTLTLYALIAIALLLAILAYLTVRAFWSGKKHSAILQEKNSQLEEQKNQLQEQKTQLESQKTQLEEQQEKLTGLYNQLRDVTQSKLTFFTNVSHDLRTPLTLIADPVEQLAKADNLTPQQRLLMQLADKNARILMRLINQILDFRKMENGMMSLNLVEVDVKALIQEWSESFVQAARRKHLHFSVDIGVGDYSMAVDTNKLERIYFNLISNAFKYTQPNGDVNVNVSADATRLRISVKDTGRGIADEDVKKIFENFFMADQISSEGSGIGLALTKSFVELHGGEITVESKVGKGSEFVVTIPITHVDKTISDYTAINNQSSVTEELADVESVVTEPSSDDAPIALVIDDNADIRTLIKGLLCDKFQVIEAADGAQGIRLASRFIPDIIICDVMMPGIDGMETCRRIKDEVSTSHIPVLLLTACALDEQRIQGYECGADAYLSKPFNSRVLLARIEALILNRRRINSASTQLNHTSKPNLERNSKIKNDTASDLRPASIDIDDEFYNRFSTLVNDKMSDPDLSVEDIASDMGLSRVQFYRKIKALTNYSPAELLRAFRLKRAQYLIKTSQDTIAEIGYTVGFSSSSYFTKCYREYFGETPKETQQRTSAQK